MQSIQAISTNVTSNLAALPQKVCDWTHAGKNWVVANKKALLVATLVASVATMIAGFAVMATASRIFSTTDIIACTMQSCSFITHYSIDSTFLKGFMVSLSGLVASIASRSLLSECREEMVPAKEKSLHAASNVEEASRLSLPPLARAGAAPAASPFPMPATAGAANIDPFSTGRPGLPSATDSAQT